MKQDVKDYPIITSPGKTATPGLDKYNHLIEADENAFRKAIL
jgi:hypothetical protein